MVSGTGRTVVRQLSAISQEPDDPDLLSSPRTVLGSEVTNRLQLIQEEWDELLTLLKSFVDSSPSPPPHSFETIRALLAKEADEEDNVVCMYICAHAWECVCMCTVLVCFCVRACVWACGCVLCLCVHTQPRLTLLITVGPPLVIHGVAQSTHNVLNFF